jgi:ATP-dependent Clp protease ATP-binding subunit ClpA
MSEAFTDLSKRIIDLAHIEAVRLDHEQVVPAHLLIAMVREQTNRPGEALRRLNVSVDRVRAQLETIEQYRHPEVHSYPIPRSAKLEAAIESAVEEARLSETPGLVQPEHLLAGLLHNRTGTATQILNSMGVDPEAVLIAVLKRKTSASWRPTPSTAGYSPGKQSGLPPGELETSVEDTSQAKDEGDQRHPAATDPRTNPLARFDDQARKVMQLATQEAQRIHHDYLGTEHILLGIVKKGSGVAAKVFCGLDLQTIRLEVERIVRAGPADTVTPGKLPPTPRVKRAIEHAVEEAKKLNQNQVGTEHLLLGLMRAENGIARQVLGNLGLSGDRIRQEVLRLLEQSG